MKLDLDAIRRHYSAMDTDALTRDVHRGPNAYAKSEVWAIVVAEAKTRGFEDTEIPVAPDDAIVLAAAFAPQIRVLNGDFVGTAQLREDRTLVVLSPRPDGSPPVFEVVGLHGHGINLEVERRGLGAMGSVVLSRALGGGLVGALLSVALQRKTGMDVARFSLTFADGRRLTGECDPDLVSELQRCVA